MSDIHSCSYYCELPECIKAQRDEFRSRLEKQEPVAWLYTNKLGGRQVSLIEPPTDLKEQYQPLFNVKPQVNKFNPDWDALPVMVEQHQRMVKRIEELEAQLGEAMWGYGEWRRKAEALEAKAEPVAFVRGWDLRRGELVLDVFCAKTGMSFERNQPLYTAPPQIERVWCDCGDGIVANDGAKCGNCVATDTPPQREWQGLTDEEIGRLTVFDGLHHVEVPLLADFARAIEAKLKEKNT